MSTTFQVGWTSNFIKNFFDQRLKPEKGKTGRRLDERNNGRTIRKWGIKKPK